MTIRQRIQAVWNLIVRGGNWMASMSHRDFDRIPGDSSLATNLRRPYEQSVWVSRAVKYISGPIAAVPLRFEDERTEQEIEDDELERYWRQPARRLSYADTIEATVGWLSLAGEAFWLLGDEWLLPFPEVARLEPFVVCRPDSMTQIVHDGELMGWKFRDKNGRDHTLLPEQVIHLKYWNPYDEWRGLAPYPAAQIATEADYFASMFNRNLWEQSGDRGQYVISKGGVMTDAQMEQIKAGLQEKRAAAQRGQFKTTFLTADVTVEDPKVQTIDAAATAVRLQNRHEIALAFGVPPSMFDVIASYSIGSASDRFRLIEETCMPIASKISESISMLARRQTRNANVCGYMDWDEHSTMQAVRRERIASATALWQMGQPMQAINEYLRMGLKPFAGWDTGFLSFSLVPVDQVLVNASEMFNTDEDPKDEPDDDSTDDAPESLGASMIRAAFDAESDDASEFQRRRPKRELARWRTHAVQQARIEKMYYSRLGREIMSARADTLARIAKLPGGEKSIQMRSAAADIVFDFHRFKARLLIAMRDVSIRALKEAGQTVMDEMEIRDPWETPPAEVIAFNRTRENKIVGAAQDIFRRINGQVEESLEKGESIADMSDRIKTEFNTISRGRAKTIARTEMGAAYGQGRQVAMESAGVRWKEWLTSGKANVRQAHVEANGQKRRVTEAFDVGGEDLESPGDPDGSPENVINCNCVAIAIAGPHDGEDEDE